MFIAQSELFKGLGKEALDIIVKESSERAFHKDDVVFREGQKADTFYVLLEGSVHLVMGRQEELCFIVSCRGEVFGWSALVDPYRYQATAICTAGTRLIQVPASTVDQVAKDLPADGTKIYKNLAGIVTGKLRGAYRERISDLDMSGAVSDENEDS